MRIKKLPLWAAIGICLLSLTVMFAALLGFGRQPGTATFVPPPFEENAVRGVPDVPTELGWSQLDVGAYQAWVCGVVTVENDGADIWFTNPENNTVWLKLRVLDADGKTIGETGIIKPGEYVRRIQFTETPEPSEAIGLKLMGYEPETYHSAGSVTLNTQVKGGKTE